MKKEIIEKYIQFAIDNGMNGYNGFTILENEDIRFSVGEGLGFNVDLIRVITSKEFIEAVTRGLRQINNGIGPWGHSGNIAYQLTIKQAIAIRENSTDGISLEDFITNLLK